MLLRSNSYFFQACNFTSLISAPEPTVFPFFHPYLQFKLGCFLSLPLTGLGPAEGLCFCSWFQHLMPQQLLLSITLNGLLMLGRDTVNTWQLCKYLLQAAKKLFLSIFRNYFREVLNHQISINLKRSNKIQSLLLPEQPTWQNSE